MQVCEKIVHYIEFPKTWSAADCFIWTESHDMTPCQVRNYPHLGGEGKKMLFREAVRTLENGVVEKVRPEELTDLESIEYPDGKKVGVKVVYFGGEGTGIDDFLEQPLDEHLLKVKKDRADKLKGVYEERAKEEDSKHDSPVIQV